MKSHLLRNHSALLRKSKAATPASRAVLDRIKDYEAKNIITAVKAAQLRNTLNQRNYSPLYVQKTHKELDELQKKSSATVSTKAHAKKPISKSFVSSSYGSTSDDGSLSIKTSLSSKSSIASSKINPSVQALPSPSAMSDNSIGKASSTATQQWHSILLKSGTARNNRLGQRSTTSSSGSTRHITWEDQSVSTAGQSSATPADTASSWSTVSDKENKGSSSVAAASTRTQDTGNNNNKSSILDPAQISGYFKPFNADEIKQLFVEMCFFARLGFLQPPCCLNCTYRESIKKSAVIPNCPRWTIWRKDANMPLHPSDLAGNVVVIQCHAARQLSQGVTTEGYTWNADNCTLESVNDQ